MNLNDSIVSFETLERTLIEDTLYILSLIVKMNGEVKQKDFEFRTLSDGFILELLKGNQIHST